MQLSELLSSSQKNEQFLNQLMNQVFHSGDQTTPLCIRHLIATHRLDVQYLTDMINTFPDSDDTLLDLVADALCNADIMPNRTQAEQKAAELIRESAGKPASCKEAFASLPLNIQHDLISCCCCCCSTYKNIDPNIYQTNSQRQVDEFELLRYAVAFPNNFKRLIATIPADTLFQARFDVGDSEGRCIMRSVFKVLSTRTQPTDSITATYYQELGKRKQQPVLMERIDRLLDYSAFPDTIGLPQIPADLLELEQPLLPNTRIADQLLRDIQASKVMAVESVILDHHLTLIVFRQANHRFYPVSKKLLPQFIPLFANRSIRKFSLAPHTLIASLRVWQKPHLFAGTTIFPYKTVIPLLNPAVYPDELKRAINGYNLLQPTILYIISTHFYYNLLQSITNASTALSVPSDPLFPKNWDLLSWYYYTPNAEGMITASHSPCLFCIDNNHIEYAKEHEIIHNARQLTIRFISGQSIQECKDAFLSIASERGVQKWSHLALTQVLPDGYCFVCESASQDYFFDLLHSWAEKAVVSVNRQMDVEIQVSFNTI